MKYHISAKAYTKMLLHAAKYPHKAVNGVLLGEDCSQDSEVYAHDAIPLFHQCLGLAPMLEVALNQVCRTLLSYIDMSLNWFSLLYNSALIGTDLLHKKSFVCCSLLVFTL